MPLYSISHSLTKLGFVRREKVKSWKANNFASKYRSIVFLWCDFMYLNLLNIKSYKDKERKISFRYNLNPFISSYKPLINWNRIKGSMYLSKAGWQSHFISNGGNLQPIRFDIGSTPKSYALGAVGMPGYTIINLYNIFRFGI